MSFTTVLAQEGRQRLSAEERTKMAIEKIAPLNLDTATKAKTAMVLKEFYEAQEKAMAAMRQSGNMDREAMREKRQQLVTERDSKLKLILTEEQLKKWKEEIEPSMRPQRQPGK